MGFNKHCRNVTCNLLFSLKQEAKSLITAAGCHLWHCEVLAERGWHVPQTEALGLGYALGSAGLAVPDAWGVIWAVWGDGLIAELAAVSPHGVFGPGAVLCHFSGP